MKTLSTMVENKLVRLIPQAVAAAGIREPVYCLALCYDPESECLPPLIGIGLERERQAWVEEHGRRARDFIWNPAEFAHFDTPALSLDDPELESACGRLNDELETKGSWEPARKLLNNVAAQLRETDWGGKIDTTPDFVAYAVDLELSDLNRNLKASLPEPLLTGLKSSRLL
jgi:hypothetical protein